MTATQQHIPDASGNTQVARQQNYAYDELNRLAGMEEYLIAGGAGLQAAQWYYYDRFGNRQINDVATTSNVNRTQFTLDQTTNRLYSQTDVNQSDFTQRQIRYDLAGNQTYDQYTSSNAYRVYDSENRMVYSNVGTGAVQSTYTYDTDGKRVRTSVNNQATWFIYGLDGELVAEYDASTGTPAPSLPTKEYGYRNGELLIVAEAPTSYELVARHSGRCADVVNMWTHNGVNLVQYDCWGGANQRFRIEAVGGGYYRLMAEHSNKSVEIEGISYAHGARVIQWDYVGGQNQQWSIEATDSGYVRLTARHSGLAMEVSGGPGATHNGADLVQWGYYGGTGQQWKLRGVGNSNTVKWLINDHLGTPRMIADGTGSLAGITRKDYLPFGEELTTQGGRSASQGYRSDSTRQGFTGYEHDAETNLEFAEARYFASVQGRFTSVDPLAASATVANPQTLNRYTYVLNSPVNLTDPTGLSAQGLTGCSAEHSSCDGTDSRSNGEAEYEQRLQNTFDAITANNALGRGDGDAADAIVASNSTLDYVGANGRPVFGRVVGGAAGISRGIEDVSQVNYVNDVPVSITYLGIVADVTIATIVPGTESAPGLSSSVMPLRDSGKETGDRGHLIAKALGGLPISKNLFRQNRRINNSEFKSFEYSIRRQLTANPRWSAELTVQLLYPVPKVDVPAVPAINFRAVSINYTVVYRNSAGRVMSRASRSFANR